MSRQTITIAALLFGVWLIGIFVLSLVPDESARSDAANESDFTPLLRADARVSSVYQDRSGRYTVFGRHSLREVRDPDDHHGF